MAVPRVPCEGSWASCLPSVDFPGVFCHMETSQTPTGHEGPSRARGCVWFPLASPQPNSHSPLYAAGPSQPRSLPHLAQVHFVLSFQSWEHVDQALDLWLERVASAVHGHWLLGLPRVNIPSVSF